MLTLTSDFESDSFVSEMSLNGDDNRTPVKHLRRTIDIQGEKLNEISTNNRELVNVQSQLARLRSELEKSEMLRQTLEYELTLLRTQHGKQTALTHQLQEQFNTSNQQMKQLNHLNQTKDHQIKEKEQIIQKLQNETETLHDRERRIEALNEQIHKMEKTFSDSESLSRQNLAQNILAKERQTELKRDSEVIQIKLQYSEQALEQERLISNEAKLNVQLLTNRLNDLENQCETLKLTCSTGERKIDELQRQCSNEKLLRSTLAKIQSELETKCAQTQQLSIDYEKQMKHIREELSNYRRKYRNNEEKYSLIVNKTFEYLRLSRIINETGSIDQVLPTAKQLEELKLYIEQLRTSRIDQTNEINRLKKTIERLNKSSVNFKQMEEQTEVSRERLQIELDQSKEKNLSYEENLLRSKREREQLIKEIEKKSLIINSIDSKMKILIGKNSSNIENDFKELEYQWKSIHFKCHSLEEKLIERDNGTLIVTQKLEEQVQHLKIDFNEKHQLSLSQRDQLIQKHLNDINYLNNQLIKMESRVNQAEFKLTNENERTNELNDQREKIELILKHLIAFVIPLRKRYYQLIDSNRFLKKEINRFDQIKQIFHSKKFQKNRLRIYVIFIIGLKRFVHLKRNCSLISIPSSNLIYDQAILSSFNRTFLLNINEDEIFQSLIIQMNHFSTPIQKGSLIKLIASGLPTPSSHTKTFELVHSLVNRLEKFENEINRKEMECSNLRQTVLNVENEVSSRVDYYQFERICEELQRALDREKQAQDLLNEQNNQLKSLTDILHQTQKEKDLSQDQFNQLIQTEKYSKEKLHQLTKAHQQMDENVKRAEKAIRLVVSDKEQISLFCTRINSALNVGERRGLDHFEQLISQLDALVQLPSNIDQKKSPPEMILCQTMAEGFTGLLNRLKELIFVNRKDLESLKEHCQMLTEQFRQLSLDEISQIDSSSQTVLVQAHPVRVQVNHHPQSAFKPIKPEED